MSLLTVKALLPRKTGGAVIARIASQDATATATATPVAATFPATPTQGNLLVGWLEFNDATSVVTAPSGWSQAILRQAASGAGRSVGIFYKVAGASEPTAASFATSGAPTSLGLRIAEYSSSTGWLASPLDVSAGADSGTNTVVSQTSGTTAATAKAVELAVAGFVLLGASSAESWTNGFVLVVAKVSQVVTTILFGVEQVLAAVGTQETTENWTSARRVAACIATFQPN
jgi:hypothetical protein